MWLQINTIVLFQRSCLVAMLAAVVLLFSSIQADAGPAANGNSIRYVTIDSTQYVYLDDVARFYGLRMAVKDKTITLSSTYSRLFLTVDKRVVTINSTDMYLSFPVREGKKHKLISLIDFSNIIDPVLRPLTIPRHMPRKIVIDAGHGGKDPGCQNSGKNEKDINLQVALLLAQQLRKRGYIVALTRQSDIFLTLKQRVQAVNKFAPDLFISLHCNASESKVGGSEVYCATLANTPPSDSTVISKSSCLANAYDLENSYLAYQVQKRLTAALQTSDRGVRRKRYTVISDINAPSILVEMGFLTEDKDRTNLTTPAKQSLIAIAIANAVDLYKQAVYPKVLKTIQ